METKSELRDYTQDQFVQHQQSMTSCKTVPTFEEPHVPVEQRTDGSSTPGRSRSNSGSSTKTPRPAIPNQKANIPPPAPVDTSKGSPVAPRKKVLSPNPSKQRPPLIYPKRN